MENTDLVWVVESKQEEEEKWSPNGYTFYKTEKEAIDDLEFFKRAFSNTRLVHRARQIQFRTILARKKRLSGPEWLGVRIGGGCEDTALAKGTTEGSVNSGNNSQSINSGNEPYSIFIGGSPSPWNPWR